MGQSYFISIASIWVFPYIRSSKSNRALTASRNTMTTHMNTDLRPIAQGLYDPQNEHDACGVGFVAHIKGKKSHEIVAQGLQILENLDHRGAVGADPLMGDGAGILIQVPDTLYREETVSYTHLTLPTILLV